MDTNSVDEDLSLPEPEIVTTEPVLTAVIRSIVSMSDIEVFYDRAFAEIAAAINDQNVGFAGPALGLYWSQPTDVMDIEVGMPTLEPIKTVGEVYASEVPGVRAAKLVHKGSYSGIASAWEHLTDWVVRSGYQPALPMWEVYVTEPTPDGDPNELITELYCAIE